ncbi:MAG: nucleoside triphosphate pyrophosphohydrolase family protein [Candidatus Micrarchaeaceae archaeon]
MDFIEYQKNTKTTAIYPDVLEGRFYYPALGLAGEVGELLNKIKKIARDKKAPDINDLKGEIGDVLWYLSQLSNEFGIDLNEAAEENIKKLKSRKERGVISGSGDNR